jgi:RimJ/RimL family protein N-acetyltransferase
MNLQATLENELLLLRPLEESDFDELYSVAKDPLIWEQHPNYDRYEKAVFAEFFTDALKSGGALIIIDKSSSKVIGSSRFNSILTAENAIEIGWSFLSRAYWGGKYNKAVKSLMINHAFESKEDIIFYIDKENIRSQKAVEKIGGYRISGTEFKHLVKDNQTDWTFRINKKDWNN